MRYSITDEERATEIDLWGSVFELVQVTKVNEDELMERLEKINDEIDAASKHSELIVALGKKYDLQMKPVAGGKKKASALLAAKWQAGEVDVAQAIRFLSRIEQLELRPI